MSEIPEDLLNACYADVRHMARRILCGDGISQVIQPTELANEAAIRLLRANLSGVEGQGHRAFPLHCAAALDCGAAVAAGTA